MSNLNSIIVVYNKKTIKKGGMLVKSGTKGLGCSNDCWFVFIKVWK